VTIDEIRRLAERPREVEQYPDDEWLAVPALVALRRSTERTAVVEWHEPLDTAAVLAGVPEGKRDKTLWRLACKLRNAGLPLAWAEQAVTEAAANCDPPFSEATAREKVARAYGQYDPEPRVFPHDPTNEKVSAPIGDVVRAETKLRFRTAREIGAEVPETIDWVAYPWAAAGALTELDAKVKIGKTTWLTALCRAVLDGLPFMGQPTRKSKVVYLTEQSPRSFREALRRAGLTDRDDFVVLFWHETNGADWPAVAAAAVAECERIGAGFLAVDTLPQFAGMRGDSENNSGAALEAIQPLQLAASTGLAVVLVRHERKAGGEVGDSGRGSGAFAGAVDIVLSLRRAEGQGRPGVRVIHGLSRFDETPDSLVIELTDTGYVALGSETDLAVSEGRGKLLDAMPSTAQAAVTLAELLEAAGLSRSVGQRVLTDLLAAKIVTRVGAGKRGDAYRFYQSDDDIATAEPNLSARTPFPIGAETNASDALLD